ncbi:MSMEG_0569 family flavin-dependent oxidoreductase [Spirosoma endbachense]|uniref:MSMEG_0569 family flavin-dependent oxidoreductase n=1 Tax=Spirosoma endbachense TaxID=2666025 RepID=A0A6P1VYT5_9BACT|nr:MSMEG_0569 family flavin-dependent oxidoreductase [Spirosoma endbachense]QHV97784.1 MSMEG_0569 family flavin-dependent oxidoreductase [Spirosoma endbachense]
MKNQYEVIVIGAGQAGLSISYLLKQKGIDHVVFEKKRISDSWRSYRWDTFCLVTPNWQCNLPGYSYTGNDPYGFMVKDEIVDFLEGYAASFDPPVKEGVEVLAVSREPLTDSFTVLTNEGIYTASQVVVCIGNFHSAPLPKLAEKFPTYIAHVHSAHYKNPESLPAGDVLVVGTGQSGAQIAEDLHLAGRNVHLCVGKAPRCARLYRGKDVVEWLDMMQYYDIPVDKHPEGENVRDKTNHYVTGRDGGREIDLRKFALEGMKLYGVLNDVSDSELVFAPNLKEHLDYADKVSENIKKRIDQYILDNQIEAPTVPTYVPVWEPASEVTSVLLENTNITSIVWCIGFGMDYSWLKLPVLNERGHPVHQRGVTAVDGLYFLGLTWQNTWGSARFSGVGKDAEYLLESIEKNLPATVSALDSTDA